jgi:type II secretory ATPase GspE/PulE/Tfp pilus assembly ATPase PilB-like protein
MHTNDAAGAIARLTDMEIEPFLISSAVIAVLAQRLVRTICEKCKEKYTADTSLLKSFGIKKDSVTFYRGKGCSHCKNTGYDKRIGIFELLLVDEAIRKLIISRASASEIKAEAQKNGMLSMRVDGIQKAEKGLTTLEEVLKVTSEEI